MPQLVGAPPAVVPRKRLGLLLQRLRLQLVLHVLWIQPILETSLEDRTQELAGVERRRAEKVGTPGEVAVPH